MKAMRIVYVFAALCGGLALGYTPSNAAATEIVAPAKGPTCTGCTVQPDGTAQCASCTWP
jgi:Na+-transporting methylmalonyl-CoA/oxaloacetate decarboxylase beta subunit